MNLDKSPTREQLRELLARCDDKAGHHVVWVKRNGDVEISVIQHPRVDVGSLRDQPAAIQLQQDHPEMKMRCETFLRGNEYVGQEAVANEAWVADFFDTLLTEWQRTKDAPEVAYIRISDAERIY